MTTTATRRRPSVAARRGGYLVAAAANSALLYLTFVQPGWRAVPFLTEETPRVLGWYTLSLIAGLACNLLYVAYDHAWARALGDLVTTVLGLAVLVRVWQVFPFDFGGSSVDWPMIVRTALVLAIAGTVIGVVVRLRAPVR